MQNKRFVLSQLMKTAFQALLYLSMYLSFFVILSINNPQIINLSRTAATTMATFAVVLVILTKVYGGYEIGLRKARSVFSSLLITIVLTDLITYFQLQVMNVNPANNDRLILFGEDLWLLCGVLALQTALIYLFVALGYKLYFRINPPLRCCIVTSSQEQAAHVADKIATFRQKYKLSEVVHYECPDVEATILDHDVIFLAGIPDTEEAMLETFCYKYGKTIYLLAELEDVIISTAEQNVIDDTPFLFIHRVQPSLMQLLVKRVSDIVLSFLGLIALSPVMLVSALCILCEHNGPVFFRQKRATIGGRVFNIIKFRTMYVDCVDCESATVDDDRITPIGRVLRKYRVDELPQLFNVLKGDMSIVGPRPEMLENVEKYTQEVPEFEYRKQMKAGLTGQAQIDGKYNTTPKDKAILDLLYIENFSLMADVKLMLRTLTVFFRRDSTEGFASHKRALCPKMRVTAATTPHQPAPAPESAAQVVTPRAIGAALRAVRRPELTKENTAMETVIDAAASFAPKKDVQEGSSGSKPGVNAAV